jgi:hypothetical protein
MHVMMLAMVTKALWVTSRWRSRESKKEPLTVVGYSGLCLARRAIEIGEVKS